MKTIVTLCAVGSVLMFAGCSHDAKLASTASASLKADVATVTTVRLPRVRELRGTVTAAEDAVLSSRAMGPVVREHVAVGDRVKQGQPLIEVEERMSGGGLAQARGALAQAQAGLALAERNFRRFESLFSKQACSELELDLARMQYEQAKGAVEQANGAVAAAGAVADDSNLRAPFDAYVVEKFVSVGDLVAPGRPVIHLQSAVGREVAFSVRVGDRAWVKRGDRLPFYVDASNEVTPRYATVTEVAPSADPVTHSVSAKAVIEGPELPAGITVTVTLAGDTADVITIPATAVYATGGLQLVTTIEDGAARNLAITTGRSYGDAVEVLSGLGAGQSIVANRTGAIAEGTRIERVNG
ncbi:efflux RND transporter periplasmic adaptor subunit [candidate division KSB1 bacterium]|nr:efflux RND transporter periplasmic adaptor subunit [candidate division KSB1 bacterium]